MLRFALTACMAFAAAFVGVSWAKRGFPTGGPSASLVGELQPTLSSKFGDETPAQHEQKMNAIRNDAQQQSNPQLAVVRRDLLQAAIAYQLSPCDKTNKQNLITSLTAYTRIWRKTLDCPILMFCNENKMRAAQVTFSTPLDDRIKDELNLAFEQRGVLKSEFASDVRFDMLQFTGSSFWGDSENALCLPRLRAGLVQR